MADGSSRPLACARQRIFHSGQAPHEQAGSLHLKFAALIAVIPAKTADGAIIAVIPAKSPQLADEGCEPGSIYFQIHLDSRWSLPLRQAHGGSEGSRRAEMTKRNMPRVLIHKTTW